MMDFKNNIRLGIEFDTKNNIENKLKNLVQGLDNKKINLEFNLKNNEASKTLENLNKLLEEFQQKAEKGITLGDANNAISGVLNNLTSLNNELQKTTSIKYNDGTGKMVSEIAQGIGQIKKQTEVFDDSGKSISQIAPTIVTNYSKITDSINSLSNAKKQLNALESNGFVDKNTINNLRNSLDFDSIKSDGNLKNLLNQVKELTNTESKIIDFSNKLITLKSTMANLTDDKFKNVLNIQQFEQIIQKINEAQSELKYFDGTNLNGLKEQFNSLNNITSKFIETTNKSKKVEDEAIKDKVNMYKQMFDNIKKVEDENELLISKIENGKNKSELKSKNTDRKDELKQVEAINKALEEEYILKQKNKQQEKENTINNSNSAYGEVNKLLTEEYSIKKKLISAEGEYKAKLEESLITNRLLLNEQNNKIKNDNLYNSQKNADIDKQRTKLNEQLNISKAKFKDENISNLTKDIEKTILELTKMKKEFGTALPSGFIDDTNKKLNELKNNLKNTSGANFNGIKDSLNNVKTSISQTNSETKQFVNSLKEANNANFFSNINNFLAKAGLFYGISQVIGEIKNQLKDASEYTLSMDKAFSNMQMITGKSKSEIGNLVNDYKELGKQLHTTNLDMMAGMEEVTRAGFEGNEGKSVMEASILGSKISGQDTGTTTQQLIAIKNAFDMTGESMNHVVDIISKMDNVSATSFAEIATAIQRTAYSAQEAGTPFDNLVTYITTVSEKTRKSAETIGESFKTIYARFSNIKLGNLDEDGKSINDTETAMNRIGISIRSSKGEFKQFDEVLNEFMKKFHEGQLSQVDYLAGVQSLAGTRQRETLMALIENMDDLKKHQNQVAESAGSAKKMVEDVYNNSLDAKVNDLKRSFEELYERIFNSDSLKWFIEQLTNIVTVLSTVDSETIAFVATVGTLSLALMKIVKIQKELMAMKAIGSLGDAKGISQFVSILGGMSSVTGNSGRAITGLNGAFLLLSNGIRTAIASSIAFMATPIGAVVSAIGLAVGLASVSFAKYKQAEEEAKQSSEAFKNSIEGVNNALKSGDTNTATEKIKEAQKEEEKLIELIKQRKEAEGHSQPSGINGINKVDSTSREIQQNIDALKALGYTVDETTGHIKELDDAKNKLKNTEVINSIKEETKAQLDNRMNLEQAQTEYNNYISTVQNLYSEYQTLSAQENLSAEDKSKLGQVVHQLQGKVSNLSVAMDENGKVYIQNEPLIQDTISYLTDEGVTVDTLSSIRISDAKVTSEWQIGNTTVTYNEINNRIEMYKAEIQAIRKLAEAKTGALEPFVKDNFFVNDRETAKLMGGGKGILEGITQASLASNAEYQEAQAKLKEFSQAKSKIDSIYNSMPSLPRGNSGGGSTPSKGSYTPSGGSGGKGSKGGGSNGGKSEVEKYAEQLETLNAKVDTDRYFELNNALAMVNNSLAENKIQQDGLTDGALQKALNEEIRLMNDKKNALSNIVAEQKKEIDEKRKKLEQDKFLFDANGQLTNSQEKLAELQYNINNRVYENSEKGVKAKKEDIAWLEDLKKTTEEYSDLVNSKMPSTTNQFEELAKAIEKSHKSMIENLRNDLANGILEDLKKETEATKEKMESQQEKKLKRIEEEKKAMIEAYDAEIKSLQDQLKALDDSSEDKKKKLEKLKAEKNKWMQDDSVFSKKKQDDLQTEIDALNKDIKKDDINKQIEDLQAKKDKESKNYDEEISDLKKHYDKKKKLEEKSNKDSLLEQKAYAKADKLLKEKNINEILELLKSKQEYFKNVGSLLGENFSQALTEKIQLSLQSLDALMGGKVFSTSDNYNYSSIDNSGTNYKEITGGIVADSPMSPEEVEKIFKRTQKFATGGKVKFNGKDEKLAFVGDGEKILTPKDTIMLDEIYDFSKQCQNVLEDLNFIMPTMYNNMQLANPQMLDFNKIASNMINNTNDNSDNSTKSITWKNNITQNIYTKDDAYLNVRAMDKMLKSQARQY
ncbi:phage tail tape measure protein [Clostridium sp. M14]|uniref:phage tail tape measure protein n=1 Tax=Clostridium sp. M14 TaxID=2716311 RepID=UPI0013EEC63A|nr:phage tail tape measure protein [Clostridium sp. M14]MBZ9693196.1 phage tail tape measure protein [Clostridium sp. M14]